jgi:cysteine sulfinate desulfinase/cysteine desulfurase-like protein
MGISPVLAKGAIRFSLGRGNTEAEIDLTIRTLAELVPRLSND